MKPTDYIFAIITLLLLTGCQYIFTVTLLPRISRSYTEISFHANYIRDIDLNVYNADLIVKLPKDGICFENCMFTIDGGNIHYMTDENGKESK